MPVLPTGGSEACLDMVRDLVAVQAQEYDKKLQRLRGKNNSNGLFSVVSNEQIIKVLFRLILVSSSHRVVYVGTILFLEEHIRCPLLGLGCPTSTASCHGMPRRCCRGAA